MGLVLVCAATRAEHDACARGLASSGRRDHELLLTGVGPARAAQSLARRLGEGSRPELVISTGFAGSLDEALDVGTWVTAARIGEWRDATRTLVPIDDVVLVEGPRSLVRCDVVSSSALITPARDASPRRARPLVVDMESAALAREAGRSGVAIAVVRMISDSPAHPLPAFLSSVTAAMSSTASSTERLAHASRALAEAAVDPRGVAQLVVEGRSWLRRLEERWRSMER